MVFRRVEIRTPKVAQKVAQHIFKKLPEVVDIQRDEMGQEPCVSI
jgi:hypothetical protein